MPGKSRRGKRKHYQQIKKSRAKQQHVAMISQQPVVAGAPQPAATISAPLPSRAPVPKAPASPATTRAAQYPYITTELRNIGILTGIILVILIVLARVLS